MSANVFDFYYDSLPLSAPMISKGKIAQVWRIPWVSLLVTGGVGERAVQVPKTMDGYELLHNGSLDHWTRAALLWKQRIAGFQRLFSEQLDRRIVKS